jgi:TRAP-type C4-dicarboxylate transport system permease small subunit
MRRFLNGLYLLCGWLAAACMVGLLAMVLLGIIDRYLPLPFKGTDAYSGYFMAGAGFLALAYTFGKGEHIRVTLVSNALHGKKRLLIELWALLIGVLLTGLMAFYAIKFTIQSRTLHDISTSMDATPLWIPQIPMAIGCVVLFIALLDAFITTAVQGQVQTIAQDSTPSFNE